MSVATETSTRRLLVGLLFVPLTALPIAAAETPVGFRQLTSTHPVAVQRGTTSTVEVRSNFTLDGTHSVLFARPGLAMTYAEEKPIEAPAAARTSVGTPFRFRIEAPADQEPGVYEFRVATRYAVSSVGQLLVTELPVVSEAAGENGTPAAAQKVTVPAALCGTCEAYEDVDCFRFTAEAGRELMFEVYAQRVTDRLHNMVVRGPGIYLMDPILTLYGPNGQVVAQNDNYFGGDSYFYARLPLTGEYTLEMRDARYAGNPRYTYCVEVSDRPRALALFPMAVQAGQAAEVEVIGHLLGDMSPTKLTAPADKALGWLTQRVETPRGLTNPVPLLVSSNPQVVEPERPTTESDSPAGASVAAASPRNDTIALAQAVTVPVGINGRLGEPDDVDYFSFAAKKGENFRFEIEARRRGSPIDSVIELYGPDGKKLVENDDIQYTKDSRLFWAAPADGTFAVAVRDLHGRGGREFVYHLRAEPAEADFEVHGEYYYAMLAPGTRMIWFARVERLNGFDGPVTIDLEGLPAGVTLTPVTIPKGMNHCAMILSAAPDGKVAASLVRTVGRASIVGAGGQTRDVVRYGRATCEQQASGGGQARWPIETQMVGITEPLDLTLVEATPAEITLKPGEKAAIKVRIERSKAYTEPVTLDMAFTYFETAFGQQLPPNVKVAPESKLRLAGDTLEGTVVLEAAANALPVERLPIAVLARVSISFSVTTNYCSNPICLTIPAAK